MKNKKILFSALVVIILILAVLIIMKPKAKAGANEVITEITPAIGAIQNIISTTGTILPKNRLELKPPVNGRIESVLVKEGEEVKIGQTLAWMSSTERAALLDAARGQDEEKLKYWQEVYKPIALIAPINGEVIVATTQPGQTVTTNDAIVVLSDHLIVRSQVDETDIGKIKLGQKATITIDAYPDTKTKAEVEHIYYESKTVNNVTIYEVDLVPQEIPSFLRSGMNASIDFIAQSKENALLIPLEAAHKDKEESFVLVKEEGKEAVKRIVELGISDDKNVEVASGLQANDKIIVKTKKFILPQNNKRGTNPFLPSRRRR